MRPPPMYFHWEIVRKVKRRGKKATHGKEARLTFRTISQYKIHWRGTACCVCGLFFQRRLSQAITLIIPKGESRTIVRRYYPISRVKYMTSCVAFWLFQCRLSQAITLITPKIESHAPQRSLWLWRVRLDSLVTVRFRAGFVTGSR